MESPKRYHPALVTLHWLMALLVFVNLYLGIFTFEDRGGGQPSFEALNTYVAIHMTVGLTIIVLLVVRFILRLRTRRPADATAGNSFLDLLAKLVHYGLYLTVLAVTLLGLVFSLQSGRFQSTFLGAQQRFSGPPGSFPAAQRTPGVGQTPPANNGTTVPPGDNNGRGQFPRGGGQGGRGQFGGPGGPGGFFNLLRIHEWAAYALLFLVSLHILAALYHQFIRRDNLIARMWYGQR